MRGVCVLARAFESGLDCARFCVGGGAISRWVGWDGGRRVGRERVAATREARGHARRRAAHDDGVLVRFVFVCVRARIIISGPQNVSARATAILGPSVIFPLSDVRGGSRLAWHCLAHDQPSHTETLFGSLFDRFLDGRRSGRGRTRTWTTVYVCVACVRERERERERGGVV